MQINSCYHTMHLPLVTNMFFMWSVSVGEFQQPFEINVELKGVMQDASVMRINNAHQKSRMLHCETVSVNHKLSHLTLASTKTVINLSVQQQQPAQQCEFMIQNEVSLHK